jgi:hypothetical protein
MAAAGTPELVARMTRAAQLDDTLYEEVEADESATGQAALVVLLVGMASGLGHGLYEMMHGHGAPPLIVGVIGGGLGQLIGWVVWAVLTYWIGTSLFKGTATPGEMLRTLGFAQSPGVLIALSFIPFLGWVIHAVVGVWMLIAGVIAVRQAMDFTTEKAIFTVLVGWLVPFILSLLLGAFIMGIVGLVFGAAALGGAVGR